jgi:hypothetical protein
MNEKVLGCCSICGGHVTIPIAWSGVTPPTPTCQKCGATRKEPELDTIPMENPKQPWVLRFPTN